MNIYDKRRMNEILEGNDYQGRGIVIGNTPDATKAVIAYFIMGRSENSRNRVFRVEDDDVIIYPVRTLDNKLIVTNGDQTDTIRDYVREGRSFKAALETREFEPDGPNWTPRISGMLTLGTDLESKGEFTYEMSILKSVDEIGSECVRYTYSYPSIPGLGHFIHTYEKNGNPLPTFQGEPRRVEIPSDPQELFDEIWGTLNEDNKISLYVRYTNLLTGEYEDILVNKNEL